MIIRVWRGKVKNEDVSEYIEYINKTGIKELTTTPGNLGAIVWHKQINNTAHIFVASFWTKLSKIKKYAGQDLRIARYYPADDRYLIKKEIYVKHFTGLNLNKFGEKVIKKKIELLFNSSVSLKENKYYSGLV